MAQDNNWWKQGTTAVDTAKPSGDWWKQGSTSADPGPSAARSIGDSAIALGSGVTQGVKMLTDVAGADNPASRVLGKATDALTDLESPYRKAEKQARAERIKTADESGSTWEQVKAYTGSFADAPLDTTLNAVGTSIPTLAAGLLTGGGAAAGIAARAAQVGLGAAQGVGGIKGQIHESVKQKHLEAGATEADATQRADAAQAYSGPNAGSIALGGALGAVAGGTGAESAVRRLAGQRVAAGAADAAAPGIVRSAARGVAHEAPMEMLQGGQERYASNTALQGEGFDVPTWQGVAGQAALEGLASAPMGGGFGAIEGMARQGAQQQQSAGAAAFAAGEARTPPDSIKSVVAKAQWMRGWDVGQAQASAAQASAPGADGGVPGAPGAPSPPSPETTDIDAPVDAAQGPGAPEDTAPSNWETGTSPLAQQIQTSVQNAQDLAAQAMKPSEQMGLDPSAGALSAAAAMAVDSGASDQVQAAAQQEAVLAQESREPAAKPGAADPETGEVAPVDRAQELQQRLQFIEQQARANGGWDMQLVSARDAARAELAALTPSTTAAQSSGARAAGGSSAAPAPTRPAAPAARATDPAPGAGAGAADPGVSAGGQIAQLETTAANAQARAADWSSREYKPNSKPLPKYEAAGGPVDVQEANEQRRLKEVVSAKTAASNARAQAETLRQQGNAQAQQAAKAARAAGERGAKAIAQEGAVRRVKQKEQADLQAELDAALSAGDEPGADDNAFARASEDAGPIPQNIEVQNAAPAVAASPGASKKGPANVAQAPQAQQAKAQQPQAGGTPTARSAASPGLNNATTTVNDGAQAAAPASPKAQASGENGDQRAQRGAVADPARRAQLLDASERWTRMTTAERQALAQRAAGLNAVAKKNAHTRAWGDLGEKVRGQLAGAMEPSGPATAGAIEGRDIDGDWMEFAKHSGTKAVPRAEMPQIRAEHRGAMVNFMNARGIAHQDESVLAGSLKPTQTEFSRKKVAQAKGRLGGDRAILVSSDGHVLDGHHQWMAAREQGSDVRVIRLDAPIEQLLEVAREFPSSTTDAGATPVAQGEASSEVLFSTVSAKPTQGVPVERVQQIADRVLNDLGIGSVVSLKAVGDPVDAGFRVPASVVPQGALRNGEIYLFANNLSDEVEVFKGVVHELFHLGLSKSVDQGAYLQTMLGFLTDPKVREYAQRWKGTADGVSRRNRMPANNWHALAVEEALSDIAEDMYSDRDEGVGTRLQGWAARMASRLARMADKFGLKQVAERIRAFTSTEAEAFVRDTLRRAGDAGGAKLRDARFRQRRTMIWDGSEPTSTVAGQRPAYATAASAAPEIKSSQGSSIARGQDFSVLRDASDAKGGAQFRRADQNGDFDSAGTGMTLEQAEQLLRIMGQAPEISPTARAQAVAKVRKTVDAIRIAWANGPDVVVAFDMNDPAVPADARAEDLKQRSGGAAGAPEGFYWKGKTYLLASQLSTANDAARVLFHEALGHHGLRGTFGKDLDNILNQVATMRRADVDAKIEEYGLRGSSAADRRVAAEEVLAEMAQATPHLHFVKRAIAAIRNWLRANVPGFRSLAMSDADIIQAFILPARRFVEQGAPSQGGVPELAFSRGEQPPMRQAVTFSEARAAAKAFQGKPIANGQTGLEAVVSRNGLDKMLSSKAVGKSASAAAHSTAVANVDTLFQNALWGWSKTDRADNTNIAAIHRFFVPMEFEGRELMAKLTVKETVDANHSNPIYTVEAVDFNEKSPAAQWVDASAKADGFDLTSIRSAGDVLSLAEGIEQRNRGEGGAAMFSRGKLSQFKTKAVDQIHAALSHPGTVSIWDKTVGTMYHLSERAPAFRPVFQAAQRFVDDVSSLATDAADAAPRILPKLEHWADLKKQPIAAADNRAIARPIFEGTLMWGRDEKGQPALVDDLAKAATSLTVDDKAQLLLRTGKLDAGVLKMWRGLPVGQYENMINSRFEAKHLKAGILWKPEELETHFKLTPQQVDLYREFRAGVDRSIDITARADMLRALGKEYAGLRDATLDAGTLQDALDLLTATLMADAKASPDKADRLMQLHNQVVDRATQARELQDAGYAPLSRFGRYTVDVVDAAGERLYFGMFETKLEANKMKEAMAREFKGATVEQGTMSQQAFKLFQGITPESLELFGNMLGLKSEGDGAQDKAFQEYLKLTKNNHSAMKRLMHRKGITGYSEDVGRVLASFIYSNARQSAAGLNMGDLDTAINAVPKDQGELKDVAIGLRDYIKNPQEEAQAVRGLLFAQYLGGSVASAIVNMSQPFAVTFPWLSQFGGARKAAQQLGRAFKDMGTKGLQYEPELARALKNAEDSGVVSPQEVHQLMAQARGSGSLRSGDGTKAGDARAALGNKLAQFSLVWGKGFSMAEQINRRSTFIASFRLAQQQGMQDPAGFAAKAVVETQFLYNKANKMRWARGAVGGTLMTFKTYSIAYLELMQRMWTQGGPEGKKAVGMALVMLMLMGGAGGLPFAEDLEDVIDSVGQAMGYNISAKQWRKQAMREVLGDSLAEFLESGVSGLPGAPIDVSGRLGMGNLLPGTGLLLTKRDSSRDLLEIVGPAGDFIKRVGAGLGTAGGGLLTGAQRALDGDLAAAGGAVVSGLAGGALEVSPGAVRNAFKGADMAATGMYRDTKGYKVLDTNIAEALAKAIGFQPKSVAEVQEANSFMLRSKSFYTLNSSEIKAQWAKALFEKDESGLAQVRERLAAWNRNNPEQPIVVKMTDVWKKVREMGKDRTQRIADTAPKALRAQMRQEVAGLL